MNGKKFVKDFCLGFFLIGIPVGMCISYIRIQGWV